jgi:hypothetical protein
MLSKALRKFSEIIDTVEVDRFVRVGNTYELRVSLTLKDKSRLTVKDYLFADGKRKYAYHWQSENGRLLRRWDNAPHWPDLPGAPHHCHSASNIVEPSSYRDLMSILSVIKYIMIKGEK